MEVIVKKILCLLLICISSLPAFSIINFEGLNWKDNKNSIIPLFKNVQEEPSFLSEDEILVANGDNENIQSYKFYFNNNQLYKIRVCFNKEKVKSNEIKGIYKKITKDFGPSLAKNTINKKVDSYTLRGNYLKFIPSLDTDIYYIGVDTIDENGNMIDSNLYLDYVDSSQKNNFEI